MRADFRQGSKGKKMKEENKDKKKEPVQKKAPTGNMKPRKPKRQEVRDVK